MYWKKYIWSYRKQALLGFIFKLIEAFFELLIPLVVAHIIDDGITGHNTSYIIKMGLVMYALSLAGYCCAIVCQYYASLSSQGFGTLMRKEMFDRVNKYDYENLDDIGTPALITRISNDVNQLQLAVAMTIRLASRSPFIIIGSLIMSFTISVKIGIIFIFISFLLAFSIYFIMSRTQPIYIKIQKLLDKVSLITRENLAGIRVIRAFNKQSGEKKRFEDMTEKQKSLQLYSGNIASMLNPLTTVIVNTGIIIILLLGGRFVNDGSLTQGEVIALINYMNSILLSMYAFANVILIYIKAKASYVRVSEVLDTKPVIIEGHSSIPETYTTFLSFEDVSFSYPKGEALSHISFELSKNQTIGIIGGTGSGKSSLISLIPRFYDIDKGEIKIKDQNIKKYSYQSLRSMLALVPQNAVLFRGTIRDNLLWGNLNASDIDLIEALRISQSYDFVFSNKEGLETKIEASGKNISGGQRQRLTIARALVKKPELLILDDASSALDYATDAALRRDLKTLQTTVIIVSQRVSAIRNCDQILVLDHGHLAGKGTHHELIHSCRLYKEIVHSQTEGDINE